MLFMIYLKEFVLILSLHICEIGNLCTLPTESCLIYNCVRLMMQSSVAKVRRDVISGSSSCNKEIITLKCMRSCWGHSCQFYWWMFVLVGIIHAMITINGQLKTCLNSHRSHRLSLSYMFYSETSSMNFQLDDCSNERENSYIDLCLFNRNSFPFLCWRICLERDLNQVWQFFVVVITAMWWTFLKVSS